MSRMAESDTSPYFYPWSISKSISYNSQILNKSLNVIIPVQITVIISNFLECSRAP